jgi:predicted aldo/keto reductase-like oxidoreductase
LNAAAEKGFYDVALISYNYSMSGQKPYTDAIKNAASKGMGLVAMKTQCQQSWYRDNLPAELKKFYEGPIRHTALLKWALRNENIVTAIPGYTTFQQLEEDFTVATNLDFSDEEKKFLENRDVKLALLGNCIMCGHCVSTCPMNVDIPNLMRTHMYATSYGDGFKARETLNSIPFSQGLDNCGNCEKCAAKCIRQVKIAKRISEMKLLYS